MSAQQNMFPIKIGKHNQESEISENLPGKPQIDNKSHHIAFSGINQIKLK